MDKKKNSSKESSKTNLLEKAISQQKELTEAMIGLSREVVKATDIRELARKEHIASKMLNNQATALREEIAKLTGEAFTQKRKIDLLTCENDGRDKIIKQKDEMIAQLREIIKRTDVVIGYLEPKAKSKRYYIRRVDARNILKRLRGEK